MTRTATLATIIFLLPASAGAHHEAIFGPQSAIVLTADAYLSAQLFTRQTGPASDRVRETTTVLSTGFSPFKRPVSIALIVPVSVISSGGAARTGVEDAIVGVRYRADLPGVTRALSGKESFIVAVGGVELPTGTVDHAFGRDALASIASGLMSVEVGPFSAIGYGFYRYQATYRAAREGANLFVGGGVAWTPIDDPTGRLLSLQLGLSRESKFRARADDRTVPDSGGWGVYAHPTLIYGISQQLMLFGQTSLALQQDWRDAADRKRYRVGAGVILVLGR